MSDVTKIQNPSITPKDFTIQDNKIIAISGIPVSGAGGTTSDYVYYPSFDETNGNITFTLGTTQSHPDPYGPYHISGAQGEPGVSGYTPEFRINSDKEDHWEWKYTEDDDWHDLGIAASGIEGPRGPQGVPGQNGKSVSASVNPVEGGVGYKITLKDDTSTSEFKLYSPTVSTEVIPSGNRVTFTYAGSQSTYIDVMSGTKGDTGTSGISPVITTATIGSQEGHPQGGTEVTVFDINHPEGQSFTAWNGINGQGATVELKDGNGIHITNNGNEYIIAVSADYATKAYAEEASAAAYSKALAAIPPLDDYYHKSETSGANEISTALAEKLNIVDLPNYDGENGIYVDDLNHIISISADYKAQIEAVSGKVTPPTATTQQGEYYIWSTVPTFSGWKNIDDWFNYQDVLLYSEIPGVFKPENGISANYSDSIFTFGLSGEYEDAIKAVSGKVDKPGTGSTGILVYNATYSSWEPFDLDLPINIGNNNTVTNDSIGAIGNNCIVGKTSFAMSTKYAAASGNAFAFGDDNVAYDNSFAFGWGTTATLYSFAGGQALSANNRSIAFGNGNIADYRSFAFGDANTATYWSVAAGRGLAIQGSTNASTGFGGLVIGGWNKTSADVLFVAGNGTGNGNSRSDAFILYPDGSVVEGYNNTFTNLGIKHATHIEGAYNQVSAVYTHVEGHANTVSGYGIHVQGGYNQFFINNISADTNHNDPTNRWNIWGISIEGMANATTTEPTSGTLGQTDFGYVHGGILKVIGNGTRTLTNPSDPSKEVITRSDALRLYRDGSMWIQGSIGANGGTFTNETVFSAATGTFDNSYIKCINDNSNGYYARFGVGSYGGAVIKAGDTNGSSPIQVDIKPTANNYELIKVERNNSTVGYLIPAVTATTTAGLTDDGILHIIIES